MKYVNKFMQRLKLLRYNFFVSQILVVFATPVYLVSKSLIELIRIKIKVNGKNVNVENVQIQFPKNIGIGINSKLFWKGMSGFEPITSKTLSIFFKSFDVFFDVGSNFGFYSVLSKKLNPSIDTYCFEPLPNIFRDNNSFHSRNNLSIENVYNLAVSNHVGEVEFYVPNVYSIESEITSATIEKDFFYNQSFSQKKIKVLTVTLDSFYERVQSKLMNKKIVLKIDVEGHEGAVIEGGRSFIKLLRPFLVIEVTITNSNIDILKRYFTELNYSLYCLTEIGFFKINYNSLLQFNGCRDFLFIPNDKLLNNVDYITFESLENMFQKNVHH